MSRIITIQDGNDLDRVRVCDEHGWASRRYPCGEGLPLPACPQCVDYDAEAGKARYRRLAAAQVLTNTVQAVAK